MDEGMRALIEAVSSFMWGTMGHNGVWGQVLIVIFFDFFLRRLERGTKEHMSSNLDIELKVRISEAMSRQIDKVVATRPEGVNRSDIVREAIASLLTDQLHQSGKDDLRKAASRIKRSLGK
jgi:Arc/MetJ-type ribon-helix-helix transcriptional regulator